MASDKRERENSGARDQAEGDHPSIADGIDVWTDERDGDDEMSKRKPIGAVCEEGVASICHTEPLVNSLDPRQQMNGLSNRPYRDAIKKGHERTEFGLEWKGRDAAQQQSDDEQSEPESNAMKVVRLRHGHKQNS